VYAALFPFYLAEKFLTPRCKHSNALLKSINKTNIRTNTGFIYINISFILTNISLIYTFLRGDANYPAQCAEFLGCDAAISEPLRNNFDVCG
jgi:hypothetical protein